MVSDDHYSETKWAEHKKLVCREWRTAFQLLQQAAKNEECVVAVLVLHDDAVDGKGNAILEPGFHPVGVHVVAAGKQFRHNSILQDLIFGVRSLEPMPSSRCRMKWFLVCPGVSARFLHGFKTCKGCKSLQNRTKSAETRSSKSAMHRLETTFKRNFQKLRESPGVRYESVGRGFESLPSHHDECSYSI